MRTTRSHQTLLPPSTLRRRTTPGWRAVLASRVRKFLRKHQPPAAAAALSSPLVAPLLLVTLWAATAFFSLSRSRAPKKSGAMFDDADWYALGLSLMAGLATSVGGLIAVWKKPDSRLLAFLLGTAIGVMATLSVVELYVKNVIENGFVGVTLATGAGAALYMLLEPLLPKEPVLLEGGSKGHAQGGAAGGGASKGGGSSGAERGSSQWEEDNGGLGDGESKVSKARLMRLGMLMAITMTLHNLPEGFAVAFSSFTDIGPVMAAAIGVHNVPEGIIVAAPVYAATGSRRQALLMATASGLSEPAGALLALCFIKPYLTPLLLQYMLAGTGGVMSAVCVIELLPEGRKCRHDGQLLKGIAVGSLVMLGTLYVGV
mmetsp:Transcript_40035/g.99065  ORF Transcript_40035/g.99065 Transcript_40035/m.99065 type:complete len:373 (-) Transcript_40035:56-1174(-)